MPIHGEHPWDRVLIKFYSNFAMTENLETLYISKLCEFDVRHVPLFQEWKYLPQPTRIGVIIQYPT